MERNGCVPSAQQLHFKKLPETSETRLQSHNSSFNKNGYFCIALCVTIVTVAIQEIENRVLFSGIISYNDVVLMHF